MRIFRRIIYLLLFPAKEWKLIAEENNSRKTIFLKFVVPLLFAMTGAIMLGALIYASLDVFSVLFWIATLWASLCVGLFISAFFVTEFMAVELDRREHKRDFALMAYSSIAAYLMIIIVFLSPLIEFIVLALYSCYLYWSGIPHLIQIEDKLRMKYGLLSLFVTATVYSLMFFVFSKIFKAIFL